MNNITRKQCSTILKKYIGDDNYELIDFQTETASEASIGLMSTVVLLKAQVKLSNKLIEVSFFIKLPPQNPYHIEAVNKGNCYIKESAFYGELFSDFRSFLLHKSIPNCYSDSDEMIVLEDLSIIGYKHYVTPFFDFDHIKVALKALADVHAASLLFENKIGKKLDQHYSAEMLRPWFTPIDDHPGYKENLAAARIMHKVLDKYFAKYPPAILDKVKQLLLDFSKNMRTSEKYRNVLSHLDLWCNNIMFKYDTVGQVTEAVIIDFQMFGYNPASLDVLMLIHCNTRKQLRDTHYDELLQYYYNCLSDNVCHHGVNINSLLTMKEFRASMEETLPTALTAAPVFIHTVTMPDQELASVVTDPEKFQSYMEGDRSLVLHVMEKYKTFKNDILSSMQDLINYIAE